MQHRDSAQLRENLQSHQLNATDYYRQLLKLIYRFLFLMVAESRNLLLAGEDVEKANERGFGRGFQGAETSFNSRRFPPAPGLMNSAHSPLAFPRERLVQEARIYEDYYSITRLRVLAKRPSYRQEGFQDLWQGVRVTFRLFDESWRGELLELSPLNGDLFGSQSLGDLDKCAIDNHDLLVALRELSLYERRAQLRRVNYAALDVEELGSVYESLLDFTPQIRYTRRDL